MRKTSALVLAPAVALAIAACGSSSHPKTTTSKPAPASTTKSATASSSSGVTIDARPVSALGTILVNAQGKSLYIFEPDKAKKVTCTGGCAHDWPPVKLASGEKPIAGSGVVQSLLGEDPDPSGGEVVTYKGWPLYTYISDSGPGIATGQATKMYGGLWYVISNAGKVVTK